MIPLTHRIRHDPPDAPAYALRLVCKQESMVRSLEGTCDVRSGTASVRSERGCFDFQVSGNPNDEDLDGDVFLVFPQQAMAARLIRRAANSNTILVTEECDQLCVMCSQPPKAKRYDQWALYRQAIRLAPADAVIGISGGEPTLLKGPLLEMMADVATERPDVLFHVLTNAQHFEVEDVPRLADLAEQVIWGVPLYAANADSHDVIVGKKGAYERLLISFEHLFAAGAAIELRTVVMQQNIGRLPDLAEFAATHLSPVRSWAIMQLEHYGYAKLNWDRIFVDTSKRFGQLATALSIAETAGLAPVLFNFPLCSVPEPWRRFAKPAISDWKQRFLTTCQPCRAKEACGGFFEWYPEHKGFQEVHPL